MLLDSTGTIAMNRLAVFITVYNAPDSLVRTLQSVDIQDEKFDIHVIDDGSEPPVTLDQADYVHRIRVTRLPVNTGVSRARNTGLRQILQSGYDYVAIQDAGDQDVGGRLARQTAFLDKHPDIAIVGAWARYVDATGRTLFVYMPPAETGDIRRRMRYGNAFVHPACMIRLDALRTVGLYSHQFPVAEDFDLFYRLTQSFACSNIQEMLIIKEETSGCLSVNKRRLSLASRIRIQIKYFSFTCFHAYMGILYSVLLFLMPYKFILGIKRLAKQIK